jgi:hypothetical protein
MRPAPARSQNTVEHPQSMRWLLVKSSRRTFNPLNKPRYLQIIYEHGQFSSA